MKIVYVTTARLPTEKAHGIATAKLCEEFARLGAEVIVVAPRLWRRSEDYFAFYGVERNVRLVKIPTIDLLPLGIFERAAFLLQEIVFSLVAVFWSAVRFRSGDGVFFSHDYLPLYFLTFFSRRVYYDIHHFPEDNAVYRRLMRMCFGFAVQTRWKIGELARRFGIPEKKIVYWPNGTDVERFGHVPDRASARESLGIPQERFIALYAGSLHSWKGVDTFVRATPLTARAWCYSIGGSPADIERLKREVSEARDERVVLLPFVPPEDVLAWYGAADVLVLPNTATQKVSLFYTSPMKLFEYLATGKPIVASRIPSVEEVVDESAVFFAEADNPQSFADAITFIRSHPEEAAALGRVGRLIAQKFTWRARAEKILAHIEDLVPGCARPDF